MQKANSLAQRRQSAKQQLFLDHFRTCGIITPSAEASEIPRQLVYYWRKTSPSFVKRMLDAENESRDTVGAFAFKSICEKAREGNRQMQKYISKEHGEKKLRAVMRGENLRWKGINV